MTGAIIPGFPSFAIAAVQRGSSGAVGDVWGLAFRNGARRTWSFGHGPKTTIAVPASDAGSTGRRTHMHAVIKTGGKQYRVAPGDTVKVETLAAEVGQQVTLSEVLAVSNGDDVKVGSPFVAGAAVVATVVGPRAPRQGHDLQDEAPQALSEASGASSELHRAAHRLDRVTGGQEQNMAHKKAGGSSRNGRDSQSKRLGVKIFGGQGDRAGPDHRSPARHPVSRRRQRRHGPRPHPVLAGGREGQVRCQRARRTAASSASSRLPSRAPERSRQTRM